MMFRDEIGDLVSARTGIEVNRGGIDRAVRNFVERRSRKLEIAPERYSALLAEARSPELERLINAVTVGFTWFFRDAGQLTTIETLLSGPLARGRPVRIWVPGCSTGEDAYSLALIAARVGRDVEILGTDVNSQSVQHAQRGAYGSFSLRELDPRSAALFARRSDGTFEICDEIRARVTFAYHNLVERPPTPTTGALWDVILCRNVLIYFTRTAALATLASLARALSPGGYLILGASEVVFDVPPGLEAQYVAHRLAFRKSEAGASRPADTRAVVPRDWLLPTTGATAASGLVSAFPFSLGSAEVSSPARTSSNTSPAGTLSAGHALLEGGDANGAKLAYADVALRHPTNAEARMYTGVARYLCGEIEPALRDLRAALFLDDLLWPAAFYLALCHENGGHPEEALRAYEHVVRLAERVDQAHPKLYTVFDAWRSDLTEVARRRVTAAKKPYALMPGSTLPTASKS